jgi:hypothetical protein
MARRGFTPGGDRTWASRVRRLEASSCVVYYRHPYSLKASFLHLAQERYCAAPTRLAHAI